MSALIALCIRRPVFTWVLVLTFVVLGLNGLGKMPVERFPNIEVGFVAITISAPGLSAEQVESEVSTKVESALGTVGGLDRLDSFSSEGLSMVWAQFVLSKSQVEAANDVRDRLSRLADELPAVARPARIETWNPNAAPVILIAIQSPNGARTPLELAEIADTSIKRELQSIKGVGEVKLMGGETRAMSVVLDPLRLRAADLTAQEVQEALARENLEAPGGTLADGDSSLGVRLAGKARTAAELDKVVVARRGDLAVRIEDVGRVEDGALPPDSVATRGGKPTVVVAVAKAPGANTVGVVDEVRDRLELARTFLPDGVEAVVVQDNSEDVRNSLHAVTEHLVLGAVLAAIVVLLFLRSWRATLIAGLAIPSSIVGTFMLAQAFGITLNLLSLLGLTLAVGIVIDDAIVVVENVSRVLDGNPGMSPAEAAHRATKEIALAVLATTLSLVAVFLPVATMEGIVGRYLAPFGLTMSASILLSMAVAFTLTPMLCSRWLKPNTSAEARQHHVAHDTMLDRIYGGVLAWLMRRRWVAGIAIVLALVSIVPLAGMVPATFVPIEDSSRFVTYVRLPENASIEATAQVAEQLATELRKMPYVHDTVMTNMSVREATITSYLSQSGVQEQAIQRARTELIGDGKKPYLLMFGPSDDFQLPGPDGAGIQFVVRGSRLDELHRITSELLEAAKQIPGTVDHGLSSAGAKPELRVSVDRTVASKLGVAQADVGAALALIERRGIDIGNVRDTNSRADISMKLRLRVESPTMSNDELVRSLTVRSKTGALVPLSDIATTTIAEGPGMIRRVGRQRQMTLFMNTKPGTSDTDVIAALEKKMKEIEPTGRYRGEVIGNAKEMEKAGKAFLVAIGLSFAFMYLVLAAQFESWAHPVTILSSLPLTLPFGIFSLLIGGQSLNLFSALGFLVLFGVVKKNSILQVDRIIQLRAEGQARGEAVMHACLDRLRPILMTTLAFVAGMLPLIVSSGAGAATNRAISVGVLGGQTLSLALTLVVTPILYTWLDDLTTWRSRRRERRLAKANGGQAQPTQPVVPA